jgi:hypothetical protein
MAPVPAPKAPPAKVPFSRVERGWPEHPASISMNAMTAPALTRVVSLTINAPYCFTLKSFFQFKSSSHATASSMRAVRDFRELEKGYGNQVSRNMNSRPPNLASTPKPDTKYGAYSCGTLSEKFGRV